MFWPLPVTLPTYGLWVQNASNWLSAKGMPTVGKQVHGFPVPFLRKQIVYWSKNGGIDVGFKPFAAVGLKSGGVVAAVHHDPSGTLQICPVPNGTQVGGGKLLLRVYAFSNSKLKKSVKKMPPKVHVTSAPAVSSSIRLSG